MKDTQLQPHGQRPKQGQRPDFPRLLGGNLCVDFVNSIESPRHLPVDFLHSYADLIDWFEHVGIVTTHQAATLHEAAQHSPESALAAFQAAITLRTMLYRILLAQAHKTQPEQADLNALTHAYSAALSHATLMTAERVAMHLRGEPFTAWTQPSGGLRQLDLDCNKFDTTANQHFRLSQFASSPKIKIFLYQI